MQSKSLPFLFVSASFVALLAGCPAATTGAEGEGEGAAGEGEGEGAGTTLAVPDIAPIVAAALPASLKPASSTTMLFRKVRHFVGGLVEGTAYAADDPTTVAGSVAIIFNDQFNKVSGGQTQGLVNAALEDLDSRLHSTEALVNANHPACASDALQAFHLDLTSVSPGIDMTMNVDCTDVFSAGAGPDGIVFGQTSANDGNANDGSWSTWLDLSDDASPASGFAYFANTAVTAASSTVDFIFLENSPALNNRVNAYRVKATVPAGQTDAKTFELAFASGDSFNGLDCGFQMITDGTLIWVGGTHISPPADDCVANGTAVDACLNASDFSDATAGACDTLKTTVTIAPITRAQIAGAGATIGAALPFSNASSVTTRDGPTP